MTNDKIKVVTHNGSFHADEVTAVALLQLYGIIKKGQFEIIRTREMEQINQGDIVVDVGAIHNIETCRFDHHQIKDGKISSAGLVWLWIKDKTGKACPEIDCFVEAIDKHDCGIEKMADFSFAQIVSAYNHTDVFDDKKQQKAFNHAVNIALKFTGHLKQKQDKLKRAAEIIKKSQVKQIGKHKVLILAEYAPNWTALVHGESNYSEITHVIWYVEAKNQWNIQIPSDKENSFVMAHPRLNDDENALFIHQNGFFGVYQSKEAIFTMLEN
ncbi:MYG1 family protein [Psychromonas sp.]|uniref:MYG1 family protein n=1 Tax=Psychromonas sp. TaxID=1884585 RepID=UPI003566979C